MARTIKSRLLLGLVLPILVAILGGSFFIYSLFKESLYAELDHFLSDKLRFHRLSLFQNGLVISFNMDPARWKALHDRDHPEYYHFRYHRSGRLIMKSPGLGAADLPRIGYDSESPVFESIELPDGTAGRAAGQMFFPSEVREGAEPKRLHLVIMEDASRILAALERLKMILFTVSGTATFLVLYSASLLIRRNMRPLDDLSRQIESVPIAESTGRFSLEPASAELDPVVQRMNSLIDRVDVAIQKERQFTANAAHELRNPLAGIRSQLELALSRERSAADYRETIAGVLQSEKRLEELVENLLLLSKLEAGIEDTTHSPVSLPDLLRRSWKRCFESAEEKSLTVNWDIRPGAEREFLTSPHLVRIVLANLLQNAVTHAPPGDTIRIRAEGTAETMRVSVCNSAPELSETDIPRLFERFWRASEAREQTGGNVGIGLSLCQRITATLKGRLEATLGRNKQLCLTFELPALPTADGS